MKFYQRRSVALIVLVLAILGASVYGLSKKPADLPKVEYMNWIADEAKLLSSETERTIETYNASWDQKYRALVAVVTVDNIRGWKAEDFTYSLGNEWGLGANDMLLLVAEDDHYYVALGDTLLEVMTDTQQSKLQAAIEPDYYKGNFDAAVTAFFRQADVFYAQALSNVGSSPAFVWEDGAASAGGVGRAIFGIIAVMIVLFAVWALLDRVRYNRYRRRVVVTPGITYYPIFWGRPRTVVRPAPPRPPQPTYRSPGSSNYRPSGGTTVHRSNTTSRPSNFGNGGFGGGSRSSSSRSSGNRGSRSSGGSRGGFGRGGFGGGRR